MGKENIFYDIDAVKEINAKFNATTSMNYNINMIEQSKIDDMVTKYWSKKKKKVLV